jgi:serine/threonine protein kinase
MEETDIVSLQRPSNNHGIGCKEGARSDGYWTLLRDYASSQTVIKLKLVKNSAATGTKRPRIPSSPPLQPIKRIKMMYSTTPEMPSLSTRISTISSSSFDDRSSSQITSQYSHPTTISTECHPTLPLKKRPRKAPSYPKSYQVSIDTLTRLDAILPSAQDRESHQVDDSSYMAYRNILLGALECEKFNLCKPKYDLQGFVGCGASGLVVRAQRNGQTVVVKMIAEVNNSAHSKYHKELDNLARLDHTNIISLKDAFTCPSQVIRMNAQDEPIKTPRIFCLVMPYMEETLFDLLARHREQRTTKLGGLPLDIVQSVFAQIAAGLAHIHSRGMSHNDIKEENTLISLQGDHVYAALCDLGHARMTKTQNEPLASSPIHQCDLVDCNYKTECIQDTRLYIIYGTAAMTPPEMQPNYRLRQQALHSSSGSSHPEFEKFQGFEADVYALGLVLHSMVFGKLPEECHTWPKTMEALKLVEQKPSAGQCAVHIGGSNQLRSMIPSSLRHLLNSMLHRDHRQRLRMDQVLEHQWVRSFIPSS